jgi:sugar phosphate isomerase/epimerase
MQPYKISFALYSSRNFPPLEAQLEGLKKIGYWGVEPFLPIYEKDPKEFRKKIDAVGLACPCFHMSFTGLVDEPDRFIDIAHTIGARIMITPWLPPEERGKTADAWKKIGAALAKGAEKAGAAGLSVAWHNHDFEFLPLPDGSRPIDHLFAAAGDRVGFEIDIAWVLRGHADPAAELARYADRITVIQVKDTAPPGTTAEGGWTATGDGIVDWDVLWPLFRRTKSEHLVAEHDNPADWRVYAKRTFDYLTKLAARHEPARPAAGR